MALCKPKRKSGSQWVFKESKPLRFFQIYFHNHYLNSLTHNFHNIILTMTFITTAFENIKKLRGYKSKRAVQKLGKKLGKNVGKAQPAELNQTYIQNLENLSCKSSGITLVTSQQENVNLKNVRLSHQVSEKLSSFEYDLFTLFAEILSKESQAVSAQYTNDIQYFISFPQDGLKYSSSYKSSIVLSGLEFCIHEFDGIPASISDLTTLQEVTTRQSEINKKRSSQSTEKNGEMTRNKGNGARFVTSKCCRRRMAIKKTGNRMETKSPYVHYSGTSSNSSMINRFEDDESSSESTFSFDSQSSKKYWSFKLGCSSESESGYELDEYESEFESKDEDECDYEYKYDSGSNSDSEFNSDSEYTEHNVQSSLLKYSTSCASKASNSTLDGYYSDSYSTQSSRRDANWRFKPIQVI